MKGNLIPYIIEGELDKLRANASSNRRFRDKFRQRRKSNPDNNSEPGLNDSFRNKDEEFMLKERI